MRWTSIFFIIVSTTVHIDSCCEFYKWNPLLTKKTHIAILILARGGSKGIPLKNLAIVGHRTLLAIALQKVRKSQGFDSIWVSTDHVNIAREAQKEKVNIHWRSLESASDTASSLHAVQEFMKVHPEIDILGLVQCTSPFIKSEYLSKALQLMRTNDEECVFSVSRSYKLRWQEIGSKVLPLNFNPMKRPRRQDLNGELIENGMFYFSSRKLLEKGAFQSYKTSRKGSRRF